MKILKLITVASLLVSGTASAQDSDWNWRLAPYLWAVNISGELRAGPLDQDIDASFSDILDDLSFGGSILFEIGKGNHSAHFDYTYLKLEPDASELPSPPFPPDSTISSTMKTNIFETAYNYRYDGFDGGAIVVGARYLDISMSLTPTLGPTPPPVPDPDLSSRNAGPSWWDAFIGFKTQNQISQNWDFGFYGTIGHGGSDLPWTAQALFGRRFSNDNRLVLGARAWGINYSEAEGVMESYTKIDLSLYGLIIGYEFN